MKIEMTLLASAAAISAATGGAGIALGESALGFAMMAVAGICACIGALYYRSNAAEGIVRDIVVSLATAFMFGAAGGILTGAFLDGIVFNALGLHLSLIAQAMIGGAAIGIILTPLTRAALSGQIGNIAGAVRAFLDSLKNGGKKP